MMKPKKKEPPDNNDYEQINSVDTCKNDLQALQQTHGESSILFSDYLNGKDEKSYPLSENHKSELQKTEQAYKSGDMSPLLLKFNKGNPVEVNQGIVFKTHGLGSWRAGYMITPTDSNYEPESSRKIMDGFYFVTSR